MGFLNNVAAQTADGTWYDYHGTYSTTVEVSFHDVRGCDEPRVHDIFLDDGTLLP